MNENSKDYTNVQFIAVDQFMSIQNCTRLFITFQHLSNQKIILMVAKKASQGIEFKSNIQTINQCIDRNPQKLNQQTSS